MHYFADDTNVLLTEKSLKKRNKHINRDLKFVVQWIRANKLITGKTKIVIFKSRNRKITKHLNFRISGQKVVTVACLAMSKMPHVWQSHAIKHVLFYGMQ